MQPVFNYKRVRCGNALSNSQHVKPSWFAVLRALSMTWLSTCVQIPHVSVAHWRGVNHENRRALCTGDVCPRYQALTDGAEVVYEVSKFYTPRYERGLRYDDPIFGIKWPLPVIKEKDAALLVWICSRRSWIMIIVDTALQARTVEGVQLMAKPNTVVD